MAASELRWSPGDHTGQGLRAYHPAEKPPSSEGWFVAEVVGYSGGVWRAYFQRFGVDDQPIRCRFPTREDAIEAVEEWYAAHSDMRPGRRKQRDGNWF